MAIKIQMRRGTAAEWTAANPVLAAGEAGLETDTGTVRYGDGATAWADLSAHVPLDVIEPSITALETGKADRTELATKANAARVDALTPGPGEVIVGGIDGPVAVPHVTQLHTLPLALSEGAASVGVQVLGDSTGNGTDEWVHLLALDIAAAYPAYEVRHYIWDSGTERMPATPLVVQAPTTPRHLPFSGVTAQTTRFTAPAITGDLDVRVRILPTSWTAGTQVIAAQFGAAGQRAWRLQTTVSGQLGFTWSTDGTAEQAYVFSGTWTPPATPVWVRATLDVDNGAGGHAIALYWSNDGVTWTQFGTTTTRAGTTSIFASTYEYELAGRGGSAELFTGKVYEAQIRRGIDGPLVCPALPEHWGGTSVTPEPVGTPICTLVNGSHPGADITFLADPTRRDRMTANYGQALAIISSSHNEGAMHGPEFLAEVQAYLTAVAARLPGVPFAACTQNPRIAPAGQRAYQAQRRLEYLAWATTLGWTPIDTYGAYLADPRGVAALVNADGFHPNPAGSRVWADAVKATLGLS